MTTHDEFYIKYLQSMFGTASLSFFGILISVITLILICSIVMLNSTMVFVTPQTGDKTNIDLPKHNFIL